MGSSNTGQFVIFLGILGDVSVRSIQLPPLIDWNAGGEVGELRG